MSKGVFTWVSKVICVCFFLHSQHFLFSTHSQNQTNRASLAHVFRTLRQLHVFASSFNWFTGLCVFCDWSKWCFSFFLLPSWKPHYLLFAIYLEGIKLRLSLRAPPDFFEPRDSGVHFAEEDLVRRIIILFSLKSLCCEGKAELN